ncbi:MAG: glycosyltransferase family 2 protein [Patescibacteria group bacterium]|jgi:glycosyltransferase involved in cell wall biosynthesis
MKISVITISYNSAKTIARTIESVISQNYSDLEYIIIDGGSTDGTLDIIKKYGSRITHIVSEPDSGISDAFNKGLKLASGEVTGILNSDDWYEPETLKIVVSKLADPTADFMVGALRYWDEKGNNFIVYPDKNYQKRISYKMPHLNHPTVFFKTEVYRSVGLFNPKYHYAMDYDFFLRVFLAGKRVFFVDSVLANMSFSGASDKHAIRAYLESFNIATNKFLAGIYFIYSASKYYLRQLLILFKLDHFLLSIRRSKYKN